MKQFDRITSRDNYLVKLVIKLMSSSKERREKRLFVIEGLRLCEDACDNGIRFEKFVVSETAFTKYADSIEKFAENSDNCCIVTDSLFEKMSDTGTPQGIMAVSEIPENSRSVEVNGRYIAFENLADPSNLGAAARTAEAFGMSGIILSDGSCDPYSPKSLRASMGALLRMPLIFVKNFPEFVKECSLKTYACVLRNPDVKLDSLKFSDGSVAIIGNEANGLTEETINNSDVRVTVNMSGNIESLNASVAAAVVMWEMQKR